MRSLVKLYKNKQSDEIVGDVEYNEKLDTWNGRNYQSGGTGRHLGYGQTESGEYYLIYGTQWQGETDYAVIVSPERIIKEIIKAQKTDELKYYPELLEIYEKDFQKKEINETSKTFSVRINIRESNDATESKIQELTQKIQDFKNLK